MSKLSREQKANWLADEVHGLTIQQAAQNLGVKVGSLREDLRTILGTTAYEIGPDKTINVKRQVLNQNLIEAAAISTHRAQKNQPNSEYVARRQRYQDPDFLHTSPRLPNGQRKKNRPTLNGGSQAGSVSVFNSHDSVVSRSISNQVGITRNIVDRGVNPKGRKIA